jgi:hypothetical protein
MIRGMKWRFAWWPAVLLLASSGLAPQVAHAGAWPQDEGHGQIITQFTFYQAQTQGFDAQGRAVGKGQYRQLELAPYAEYGLTSRWTIGAQPRLQAVFNNSGSSTTSASGLAELNVFARYTVWRGDFDVVSLQGTVGTPGIANRTSPQVANPNSEYELRALYGHSFEFGGGVSGFAASEFAGRARAGAPSDELHLDLTAGLRPHKDWLLLVQSFSTLGMRNNQPNGADYSVTKLQLSAVYSITPRWAVQFGAYTELAGRHVALGNAGLAALWFNF